MVQPKDLLGYAIKLLKTASGHVAYRAVVEQAYYGAYHAAEQFEEKLPQRSKAVPITDADKKKKGSHDALIKRLELPHPELDYGLKIISQDIGTQMRMFKPLRELVTYHLEEAVRVDHAEDAIAKATDILAECAKGAAKLPKK